MDKKMLRWTSGGKRRDQSSHRYSADTPIKFIRNWFAEFWRYLPRLPYYLFLHAATNHTFVVQNSQTASRNTQEFLGGLKIMTFQLLGQLSNTSLKYFQSIGRPATVGFGSIEFPASCIDRDSKPLRMMETSSNLQRTHHSLSNCQPHLNIDQPPPLIVANPKIWLS